MGTYIGDEKLKVEVQHALLTAVQETQKEIVEYLLTVGVNPNFDAASVIMLPSTLINSNSANIGKLNENEEGETTKTNLLQQQTQHKRLLTSARLVKNKRGLFFGKKKKMTEKEQEEKEKEKQDKADKKEEKALTKQEAKAEKKRLKKEAKAERKLHKEEAKALKNQEKQEAKAAKEAKKELDEEYLGSTGASEIEKNEKKLQPDNQTKAHEK